VADNIPYIDCFVLTTSVTTNLHNKDSLASLPLCLFIGFLRQFIRCFPKEEKKSNPN